MVYLKSFLSGVLAVMIAAVVAFVGIVVALGVQSRNMPNGEAIGWDPVSMIRHSWPLWLYLGLAFLLGFVRKYRRTLTAR